MFYLYDWSNLKPNSPKEDVRNNWLYHYGSFARVNGVWFPCNILTYTTIGEPASISVIPLASENMSVYPKGTVQANEIEVLYSCFPDGTSIKTYIEKAMRRKRVTDNMLDSALARSLNTEILYSPKRLMASIKKAVNRWDKREAYVVETNAKEDIGVVPLPRTIDIVEKLWNSNDWALQEISQLLGISYNPAHGKKERMLENELLGDRDLTVMNRKRLTSRLVSAAEEFGETVSHISTEIDTYDRMLPYGSGGRVTNKEVEKNEPIV
jgi:hypothetical protein